MEESLLGFCVTNHPGLAIVFVGCGDSPEFFFFEEFRFGLHADLIVRVDFLHVLGSIEGRFISVPDTFKQTLGLLCRNYHFISPSWDVLRLGIFGV